MIGIRVLVDGQQVSTAEAKSRWELPDVIARTTQSYDHNPELEWEREEKVRDPSGELSEIVVRYRSKASRVRPAA